MKDKRVNKSSSVVTVLLGIFFGWIGAHDFYVGRINQALGHIVATLVYIFIYVKDVGRPLGETYFDSTLAGAIMFVNAVLAILEVFEIVSKSKSKSKSKQKANEVSPAKSPAVTSIVLLSWVILIISIFGISTLQAKMSGSLPTGWGYGMVFAIGMTIFPIPIIWLGIIFYIVAEIKNIRAKKDGLVSRTSGYVVASRWLLLFSILIPIAIFMAIGIR